MRKIIFGLFLIAFLLLTKQSFAQNSNDTSNQYFKAQVLEVTSKGEIITDGQNNLYEDVKVKILGGSENGKIVPVHLGDPQTLTAANELSVGEQIILQKMNTPHKTIYSVYDKYRSDNILIAIAVFIFLILLVAGIRGIGSLAGLIISLAVILFFIIPQILHGNDPLLISILGAVVILFISTYIAHGIFRQTTVALVSTFCALFLTAFFAIFATNFARLTGIGNEDIASLQIGATSVINLKGLFLAGIIIGTLGALNDVTITQAATVFEIAKSEPTIKIEHLIKKGFNVGREHILSLVNTLVLAYAGSSLFIFIFLVLNPEKVPYWVILNTETISGEVVATIAGSAGLILAVPIATILASFVVLNFSNKN